MDKTFTDILQKLIVEQGKEALLNETKCMALLAEYTKGEFKKESRLLSQAHKAKVLRAIDTTQELAICKKQQVRQLHEDYGLDEKLASDVVNTLAFVLKGDTASEETQTASEHKIDKATEPDLNSFNDCINRGAIFHLKGQYDEAIIEYNEAIRLNPDNAKAYSSLAVAYQKKGQYKEAIIFYNKAIHLDPNNADNYFLRGCTYSGGLHQYDLAIKDFDVAIKYKDNAEARRCRGNAYNFIKQYDKAIVDLDEAIRLDPYNANVYSSLGFSYLKKGQYKQAIDEHKKAIDHDQNDYSNFLQLGCIYVEIGQYDEAVKNFEKGLSLNPDEQGKKAAKQMLQKIRGY